MTEEKMYLSPDKFKELERELEELTTIRRREIAEQLEQAKSLGDLRENSEYQEARASQAALEERIAYLAGVLRRAVLVRSHHSTKVEIGSTVLICKTGEDNQMRLQVVGSSEANITTDKVSNESPIGRAMMSKEKGETFKVKTAKGVVEYTLVEIE